MSPLCPRCAQLEAILDVYRDIHDELKRLVLGGQPLPSTRDMVTPEKKRMLWKDLKEGKA